MASHDPDAPAPRPDPTESWASAPTSELPTPAAGQAVPGQPAGQPAPGEPVRGYGPGGGYGTGGGPPVPPHGTPAGGRPGFWRRATSTTGGIVGLVVAGVLVVLLVLGLAGMAAFAVGRRVADHGEPRMSQLREGRGDGLGPGQRGPGQRGQGPQERPFGPQQRGMNGMGGNGGGLGSALGGAGLGTVEHGQVTVTGADGKATVMTLQRGTVTAVGATSLSVRSTDGFTATYTLGPSTRTPARTLSNGDSVLVVAQQQGNKAVLVRLTR